MIALYLLASHLVGDFVFQTRWQAAGKFDSRALRTRHVFFYGVAFLPVVLWRILAGNVGLRGALFFALLLILHYATDSRRFRSTLGDWVGWRLTSPSRRADELQETRLRALNVGDYHSGHHLLNFRPSDEQAARAKVPPNPWEPIPLLIDQTLHLCQLALLGGLLLT